MVGMSVGICVGRVLGKCVGDGIFREGPSVGFSVSYCCARRGDGAFVWDLSKISSGIRDGILVSCKLGCDDGDWDVEPALGSRVG